MTERIEALEDRVARLEDAFTNGLARIEDVIQRTVQGLKDEQIKDLREANGRLAEDQRRLWDVVHAMQLDRSRELGSRHERRSLAHWVTGILSAGMGGFMTWLAQKLGGHG